MANKINSVLYVSVASDLVTRIWEHKNKKYPESFTSKYNCEKLVYYFFYHHIEEAIAAEKAIKGGSRKNKIALIERFNKSWTDLYSSLIEIE